MHGTTHNVTHGIARLAFTPSEVAQRFGVSKRKVYRLIAAGELGKVTVGRRWMVLATELDAYVQRLQAGEAA